MGFGRISQHERTASISVGSGFKKGWTVTKEKIGLMKFVNFRGQGMMR